MGAPPRPIPAEYKLAAQAFEYVRARNWIKLTVLIRDIAEANTAHFEQTYAHQRGKALNPHQLRDDIHAYWDPHPDLRQVTEKLIAQLQKRNPLTPKVSYEEAVKSTVDREWPAANRQRTRERLKNPDTWPKQFHHPQLTIRLQQWGNWILDNYEYLRTSKTPAEIGISFVPPARPEDDIQSISDFKAAIDNQNLRLMQACEKGPWGVYFPAPTRGDLARVPKKCLEILRRWEALFAETKGQVSITMLQSIRAKIQELERRRH